MNIDWSGIIIGFAALISVIWGFALAQEEDESEEDFVNSLYGPNKREGNK